MTQKHEKDSKSSDPKKVRFPTPPWKKKAGAETEAPVEDKVVTEEAPAQETPAEKPAEAEAVEPEVVAEAAPAEAKDAEAPKSEAAPEAKKEDSHFSNLADAFLKVQAALKKTQDELETTKAELAKATDGYTRAVADFDNYRRRTNEERPKNMLYAKGDIAKDVFPVLDNFKLGLDAAEKQHPEAKAILEGFAMIATQLRNALAQHGIVEINPLGEPFNPQEHESLSMMPSAEVPADHVLFVQRTGYKIGERLLRPASVVISAGAQ